MDAYQILVIILSTALAVLLILAIIFLVVLIKLINQFRKIAAKAEEVVDDVEAVSHFFRESTATSVMAKLATNIISMFKESRGRRGKR